MRLLDKLLGRNRGRGEANLEILLDWADRKEWMESRGFRLAFDPYKMSYVEGFDPGEEYEYMRPDWEEPRMFRMTDQHPLFNIAGLSFRSIDARR